MALAEVAEVQKPNIKLKVQELALKSTISLLKLKNLQHKYMF